MLIDPDYPVILINILEINDLKLTSPDNISSKY